MRAGLLAVAVAVAAGCTPPAAAPGVATMPTTARLTDPGGVAFAPAERWRGQVVVLDFWASWCAECKRSVPRVNRLARAFAAEGLLVVGINVGDAEAKARAAADELAIGYPIALDPELALADQLGATQLPLVMVLDRDGTIVHRSRHVDRETLDVVRRLLAPRAAQR
jgi:thiol-disulfide isomerase/thioredoxin